ADWIVGDLCPNSRPATTTASTPDAWISSAGMYASHGVSREIVTSVRSSITRRRTYPTTTATTTPKKTAPTADTTKSNPTDQTVTPPAVMAAIAVRKVTRAVASLTRLSPSRIVTIRRGIPTRRAIDVAATASGGATTAPSASAAVRGTGRIHHATRPTPMVVKTTSPTESKPIGRLLRRKSISDVRMAAAYSKGGRNPINTRSGVSATSGMNGTYEPTNPATTSSSGADSPIRRAKAVPAIAHVARTTRVRA